MKAFSYPAFFIIASAVLAVTGRGVAQEQSAATEMWEKPYSLSIQDNSFFIEEAFNQEARVVQHIFSLTRFQQPYHDVSYSFTQEWPIGGSKHQLSFELQYATQYARSGVGDVVVNYRYQLLDKPDGIAVAPRLSVILPTGDELLGFGQWGYEFNLPASKRLSEWLVGHLNAGVTVIPNVEEIVMSNRPPYNPAAYERTLPEYTVGASAIVLAHPNVNLMLEWVASFSGQIADDGEVVLATSHVLSPGIRAALNFDNLQIVPGLAVPVRFHDGESETGIFGYLSFEHGF
jgi:hypothetical protein